MLSQVGLSSSLRNVSVKFDHRNATAMAAAEPSAPAQRPRSRNRHNTSAPPPAAGSTSFCRASRTYFVGGSGGM